MVQKTYSYGIIDPINIPVTTLANLSESQGRKAMGLPVV